MKLKILLSAVLLILCFSSIAQNFGWAKKVSDISNGGGTHEANSIKIDKYNNVYTAGYTSLGTTGSWKDIFISKLDRFGNIKWKKQFGGTISDECNSIALDNKSNLYLTGYFSGTVDFDPGPGLFNKISLGLEDVFICKFDSLGNFIWVKTFGSSGKDYGQCINVNSKGEIFTIGQFKETIDLDPNIGVFNVTVASGTENLFISKLDSMGNFKWAKTIGNYTKGKSFVLDSLGNIYYTGLFGGTVDFDPNLGTFLLNGPNLSGLFVSKLDSMGDFVWAKQFTGTGLKIGYSIELDSKLNVIFGGGYEDSTDFDPGIGVFKLGSFGGSNDAFICKLSNEGNFVWAKQLGGINNDFVYSLDIDKYDNIYSTGLYTDNADFDPSPNVFNLPNVNSSTNSLFISLLDSSGNFISAKSFGMTSAGVYGFVSPRFSVALDHLNNSYFAGSFAATIDFDPGPNTYNLSSNPQVGATGSRIFVLKLLNPLCSNISLQIDSVASISCLNPGYASVLSSGAKSPYTFSWNTTPPINDSIAFFNLSGFYTIVLNDSNNCTLQKQILINQPISYVNFDLEANLIPPAAFRPAIPVNINLEGYNNGCDTTTGYLAIVLSNDVVYNSSNPLPDDISGDTLFWNFTNFNYEDLHLTPIVNITPRNYLSFGDTICFQTLIIPIFGDANSSNNLKKYCFPVRNGYDPNIISVYPPGVCIDNYVQNNQKLTYTIQFQNTGNASAININVLDSLDTDLDLSTLRVISNSHPLITEFLPGNVLKFRFDNILLPDSGSNEVNSHGYLVYEIFPFWGKPDGTKIENQADIYFDFNPVVETNKTNNTLITLIPSCNLTTNVSNLILNGKSMMLYPNPTADYFTIDNIPINSAIKMYDFTGKLVLEQNNGTSKVLINSSNLNSGIFFLEVSEGNNRSVIKVVIQK